jgi:capsular polysaccharide transport system permease protein
MTAGVVKPSGDFERIKIVARVVVALILRETKTRFGRNRFGLLWAFVEPAAYVAMFIVIRIKLNTIVPFGENIALFMLTGILSFRMFSSISKRGINALTANKALLAYPPVRPSDIILARVILETLTFYVIFAVFYGILALVSNRPVIVHPQSFFGALATLTLLSAAMATFNAVFAMLYPFWERVWGVLRLPLLLLSGIFYVPSSLPPFAQRIIWWNPVLHCVEWFRDASYLSYNPMLSIPYVLSFSMIFLMAGLFFERINRHKLFES